jgi:hypothetical protein
MEWCISKNNFQHKLLYSRMLSFRIKEQIKTIQNIHKQKELITTNPAFQKIQKGILHRRGSKKNIVMRAQKRINLTRLVDKPTRIRKESNIINEVTNKPPR